jgi:hypothetical protein
MLVYLNSVFGMRGNLVLESNVITHYIILIIIIIIIVVVLVAYRLKAGLYESKRTSIATQRLQ